MALVFPFPKGNIDDPPNGIQERDLMDGWAHCPLPWPKDGQIDVDSTTIIANGMRLETYEPCYTNKRRVEYPGNGEGSDVDEAIWEISA